MDSRLEQDLDHFFTVYQNNVSGELRAKLAPALARAAEDIMSNELDLLRRSTMDRLEEYFRSER